MTNEQKARITELRGKGKTFSAIAEELGIAVSTIKSYCQNEQRLETVVSNASVDSHGKKHSLPQTVYQEGHCRQCGADLHLNHVNQMKRFCSERCRQKWWRKHPGAVTEKQSTSACVGCGKIFNNNGNHARRYCSRECYMAYRFRAKGRATNE